MTDVYSTLLYCVVGNLLTYALIGFFVAVKWLTVKIMSKKRKTKTEPNTAGKESETPLETQAETTPEVNEVSETVRNTDEPETEESESTETPTDEPTDEPETEELESTETPTDEPTDEPETEESESTETASDEKPTSMFNRCPRCKHLSSDNARQLGKFPTQPYTGVHDGKPYKYIDRIRIMCEKCRQIHIIRKYR